MMHIKKLFTRFSALILVLGVGACFTHVGSARYGTAMTAGGSVSVEIHPEEELPDETLEALMDETLFQADEPDLIPDGEIPDETAEPGASPADEITAVPAGTPDAASAENTDTAVPDDDTANEHTSPAASDNKAESEDFNSAAAPDSGSDTAVSPDNGDGDGTASATGDGASNEIDHTTTSNDDTASGTESGTTSDKTLEDSTQTAEEPEPPADIQELSSDTGSTAEETVE